MGSENQQYAVDDEIAKFFTKTPVTREACDRLAKELVGGDRVIPVAVQGACSYTVYAGSDSSHVVQFRLKSLELRDRRRLSPDVYSGPWRRTCPSGSSSATSPWPRPGKSRCSSTS